MNTEYFFNLFLLISAIHGFLFSVIILFSKNGKEKSILYINLIVLSISLNNMQSWVIAKDFFTEYFFLDYVHIPWHFLSAPFFYMFLIHYLKIANRSKNVLNFIIPIFLTIVVIRIFFVYFYSNQNNADAVFIFERYTSIEEIISLIFSLSIFSYAYFILKKKRALFQRILSFDNLRWIHTFFKIGAFIYVFWIVALSITVYLNFSEFIYSYYPLRIATTVLIYWSGYQALIQLRSLKERKKLRMQLNYKNSKKEKIVSFSNLPKTSDFETIHRKITEQRLFTMPKLTLEILAKKLNINHLLLSSIIRSHTNKAFNDYINECRITLSKKLLADSTYKDYTITAIGLESGFNSKSNFYRAFKKLIGKTPSDFKKELHFKTQNSKK